MEYKTKAGIVFAVILVIVGLGNVWHPFGPALSLWNIVGGIIAMISFFVLLGTIFVGKDEPMLAHELEK